MTPLTVRELTMADHAAWRRMRRLLWPDETARDHDAAIDEILNARDAWGFIAQSADDEPLGFAEISIRKAANGCESQPVPFLEGIWVEPRSRRRRVGARLIAHIETFLKARGFRELGSDSLIENQAAHDAHAGWGFAETERVVYFRKPL
jgi:aminoglycoside 6'-N-acetyltransferase I